MIARRAIVRSVDWHVRSGGDDQRCGPHEYRGPPYRTVPVYDEPVGSGCEGHQALVRVGVIRMVVG